MARARYPVRISQLAHEVGLNPKTLRYYEEIGLLTPRRRSDAGYRLYDATARERLGFIAKAKVLGFSLKEIGEILALRQDGQRPCPRVLALIDRKLADLDDQIRLLTEFRDELSDVRADAETLTGDAAVCAIIEGHEQTHTPIPT